ncbi:MAG: cysteine-rich CWC family protein [Flavobacteriales bacterium]
MKKKLLHKVCPCCKKEFYCTVEENCWCEKIFITRENLMKIRRLYWDCLCEKCLKQYGVSEN